MSTRTKSPLHPSALSINDLTIGRQIIRFNRNFGIAGEYRVVSLPYVRHRQTVDLRDGSTIQAHNDLVVDMTSNTTGGTHSYFLEDMGVVPYSGSNNTRTMSNWNPVNFTVDARRREALLEITLLPYSFFDDYDYEDEFEFDMEHGYVDR